MKKEIIRSLRKLLSKINTDLSCKIMYRAFLKKNPDLDNPKSFNEKICWLKLNVFPYDKTVIDLADKLKARSYITQKGYADILVPLIGVWDRADDIKWDELPNKFVLKCNHGAAYNILCKDKNKLNIKVTVKKLKKWMAEDFGLVSAERHYSKIERKIICEKFIEGEIEDYKFFCFNGNVRFYYVSRIKNGDFHNMVCDFFMPDGTPADFYRTDHQRFELLQNPPENLQEMLKIAQDLSSGFLFVRVDLMRAGNKIYFTEMTFTPSAGMMPLLPEGTDERLGKLLDLKQYKKVYLMRKIGVIGRTAYNSDLCDGQTIKTRILVEELKRKYPYAKIKIADTFNYKVNFIKILLNIFLIVKNSQVIFISLSRNGMRVIFPIVNFLNRFFNKPVLHVCIGGSLDELVIKNKWMKKQLNKFRVNWVESVQLKERLMALGIVNAEYLPNFKRLDPVKAEALIQHNDDTFCFCTLSRVNKAKGISDAAQAIISINKEFGYNKVFLDIYGPIEDNYGAVLDKYIAESDGSIKYKGVVDYTKTVDVLKDYYALLFPTTYYGEGFPGTLLDAFNAGLPVIATDWHLNPEIITHKSTGYLYSWQDPDGLKRWIKYAIEHPEENFVMRQNCLLEAKRYIADFAMDIVEDYLLKIAIKAG